MPSRSKSSTRAPEGKPPEAPAPAVLVGLPGIGPARAKSLALAGIETPEDLLWWLPFRYEDRLHPTPIATLKADQWACLRASVKAVRGRRGARRGMHVTEALLADDTGTIHAVWFNQPWMAEPRTLAPGMTLFAFGKVSLYSTRSGLRLQMDSPEVERADAGGAHADRIVPVYRRLADLAPRALRTLLFAMVARLPRGEDPFPAAVLDEEGLPPRSDALRAVHFPPEDAPIEALARQASPGHRRLILEEFLGLQWALTQSRARRAVVSGAVVEKLHETGDFLRSILPFHLTRAQRRALGEIFDDMASPAPMYRLLHGDVGSGKTVVAFLAMAACAHQGFQAAFMAPTEVLAQQQYAVLRKLLEGTAVRVGLLCSSVTGKARREVLQGLADGTIALAVGTHSLFQEGVEYARLALAVIDEQHRFGVGQRASLVGKGRNPNVLVMTATPIPRSLAMTLYGDLDLSVLDELPPGRQKIVTAVRDESSRHRVEAFLRREMDAGRQVFVVFPLIEESEAMDLKAAAEAFERLRSGPFKGYRAALLHGRLKPAEKEAAVLGVREGSVQLLVATTVVEVGVDLPEASVMVVEHADRFGLAQLHQLRGRVGRGGQRGYCILMRSPKAQEGALERLAIIERTADGFAVAEADLALRGAGEPSGLRQWGGGSFRIANPLRDFDMLERARRWAERLAGPQFPWGPGEKERFATWASRVGSRWGSFGMIG